MVATMAMLSNNPNRPTGTKVDPTSASNPKQIAPEVTRIGQPAWATAARMACCRSTPWMRSRLYQTSRCSASSMPMPIARLATITVSASKASPTAAISAAVAMMPIASGATAARPSRTERSAIAVSSATRNALATVVMIWSRRSNSDSRSPNMLQPHKSDRTSGRVSSTTWRTKAAKSDIPVSYR